MTKEQYINTLKSQLANVKAENERFREALKFYALRKHFYGENNDTVPRRTEARRSWSLIQGRPKLNRDLEQGKITIFNYYSSHF